MLNPIQNIKTAPDASVLLSFDMSAIQLADGAFLLNEMEHWKNLSLEDLPGEIWKDVVGYEGMYKISSLGRVKGVDRQVNHYLGGTRLVKEKMLTATLIWSGYLRVLLSSQLIHKSISFPPHRLAAIAFIHNPENKPQVNHKNGIKTDNRIDNLEWCTCSGNMKHAFSTGLSAPPNHTGKFGINHPRSKVISQYSLTGDLIHSFNGLNDAARIMGFRADCICRAAKLNLTYNKYLWRYGIKTKYELPPNRGFEQLRSYVP